MSQWLDSYQIFMVYKWDITKNWLDFDDLDLIFKVTALGKKTWKVWGGGGGGGQWVGGVGTSIFSENTITTSSYFIDNQKDP